MLVNSAVRWRIEKLGRLSRPGGQLRSAQVTSSELRGLLVCSTAGPQPARGHAVVANEAAREMAWIVEADAGHHFLDAEKTRFNQRSRLLETTRLKIPCGRVAGFGAK